MSEINDLRKIIIRTFKLSGYQINSKLATNLAEIAPELEHTEFITWLDKIITNIQNQDLTVPNIELHHLEQAIKENDSSHLNESEKIFSVINAFDIPRFKYNTQSNKFIREDSVKTLLPSANLKSEYWADRYMMLLQRTLRHELFAPPAAGISNTTNKYQLKKIEYLLSSSRIRNVIVLGLLSQLAEAKYFIEDSTGVVPVDLSETNYHQGIFCEGCFVLAEGCYDDGILKVSGLGFPPAEKAKNSRAYFGTQNYFGGSSKTLLKYSPRLKSIEDQNADASIVFLSDIALNDKRVLDKLKLLFNGYNSYPPIAIVMMGPFSKNLPKVLDLKQYFDALGDLIGACSQLRKETQFVLVPDVTDPLAPNILPRPPIPEYLASGLMKKANVILATNPCRLQYCTQEIVVARLDLITKLCRNTLHFPTTGEIELEQHFARTLICQGTLAPLNTITFPTYWTYDQALSLYPLPDLIVVGDASKSFIINQDDCIILNTGSFVNTDFSFKVYVPKTRTVEDSQITD